MNEKQSELEGKTDVKNVKKNIGYYCEGAEKLDDYFPKKNDLEKLNE